MMSMKDSSGSMTFDPDTGMVAVWSPKTGNCIFKAAPADGGSATHRRCRECGDRDHLYSTTEVRWSHDDQMWTATGANWDTGIECTECDWQGSFDDTLFEDEEATDAPQS